MIVDDHQDTVEMMAEYLQFKKFDVLTAANGKDALELLEDNVADLIILDVLMPVMGGMELCEHLKSNANYKNIPILMLTCQDQVENKVQGLNKGADDYLLKPYDSEELVARIGALLRRTKNKPYQPDEKSLLHIRCRPGTQMFIQCKGGINISDMSTNSLVLDIDKCARQAEGLHRDEKNWRFRAKLMGEELFQYLISDHTDINKVYYQAIGAENLKKDLHIKFLSSREFMRVPVESLFGDNDYLCLRHPLIRTIEGVGTRKQPLSQSFFNSLHRDNEALRVLLIAANTAPPIAGVDQEIAALQASICSSFESKGLRVKIKTFTSGEATYKNICEALQAAPYHVVHYSGHGYHDTLSAEKSALILWDDVSCKNTKLLYATQLRTLVENSEIRFFYLSCCLGSTTASQRHLLDDDFLGITDSLIQAGVPSVLGFRWPVSDDGAVQLAEHFYSTLARDGRLNVALLEARNAIERDDLTWLSPVLVIQE